MTQRTYNNSLSMSWFKKLSFQIFAHEGFVEVYPVGWIPTTRDQNYEGAKAYLCSCTRYPHCFSISATLLRFQQLWSFSDANTNKEKHKQARRPAPTMQLVKGNRKRQTQQQSRRAAPR